MSPSTFAELLTYHLLQTGISDSELARSIGVRRQTVFRWKEGLVERPRAREDVLRCAQKLRLTPAERDLLLLAAGFAPEALDVTTVQDLVPRAPAPDPIPAQSGLPDLVAVIPSSPTSSPAPVDEMVDERGEHTSAFTATAFVNQLGADLLHPDAVPAAELDSVDGVPSAPTTIPSPQPLDVATASASLSSASSAPASSVPAFSLASFLPAWLARKPAAPLGVGLLLGLLALLVGLGWLWRSVPSNPPGATPTPNAQVVKVTLNAPPLPVDYPQAAPGETLLVVAPFAKYTNEEGFNVAGRIEEALTKEIAAAALLSTTIVIWPVEVRTANQVRQLVSSAGAAIVIWGEYDSGRVRVNWTVGDQQTGLDKTEQVDFALTSSSELNSTINTRLPQEIRMLALTALGRLLRDQGDRPRATAAFQRALALNPEDDKTEALLNFYLGHLAEQARTLASFNRAIGYYTAAIKHNAQLVDAYYNRGTVYLNRSYLLAVADEAIGRDLDRALADLSQVLLVRPNFVDGRLNRGVAYYERNQPGDMASAAADFSQIIALQPTAARAYFHRGLVQIRLDNEPAWRDDFTKTLALQPDYYAALNGLCWGYALGQQPTQALPYCDEAVLLDPTGASRDSRGIVYAMLGQYPEAITEFTAYLAWVETLVPATRYARYRGPVVETWIAQLERGGNPFTPATLAALR